MEIQRENHNFLLTFDSVAGINKEIENRQERTIDLTIRNIQQGDQLGYAFTQRLPESQARQIVEDFENAADRPAIVSMLTTAMNDYMTALTT